MNIIIFFICLIASILGGICGIGGGVLIKPLLDMLGILSVSAVSFLSSLSVWSMSAVNIFKSRKNHVLDFKISIPLGLGAILGGILGKQIFESIKAAYQNDIVVGIAQAILLGLMMLGTLLFVLNKKKIKMLQIRNPYACGLIGFLLGMVSSFLGIGGGPMNIAVLFYFFNMKTKQAVENSLLIILLSQTANLLVSFFTGKIPTVNIVVLATILVASLMGGIISQQLKNQFSAKYTDKLLNVLLICIILISVYNVFRFVGQL